MSTFRVHGKTRPDNILDAGDVLIIGAGLAGLFTALKLAPRHVTVLANAPIGVGAASAWAQGGIAAAIGEGDTPEEHAADTIAAGAGLVDPDIAELIAHEAPKRMEDLIELAVPFDRDVSGKLKFGREGAHGRHRIARVKGDRAGAAIMEALRAAVLTTPSINVMDGITAHSLALSNGRVVGVFAPNWNEPGKPSLLIKARNVVLATGGVGALYNVTTNPPEALGEGLAMAARAGAVIADAEFLQFHPTAIDIGRDPAPLASEALRGEGAFLADETGHRFMEDVHSMGDLAPRDIVARAIHARRIAGKKTYLDTRSSIGARFPEAFPTVYAACRSANIDPVTDLIPIAPAAHYHMGGIATDSFGRTSLAGLWACGEVASTGAHGANRLASNSLLEAVVFAARVAQGINGSSAPAVVTLPTARSSIGHADQLLNSKIAQRLRWIMATHVGVVRSAASLNAALGKICVLEAEARQTPGTEAAFVNLFTTAQLISQSALARQESRGGHYREDFPEPVEALRMRSFYTFRHGDIAPAPKFETAHA